MSWLSDSTELVSGGWLSSQFAGHGVRADQIPSTGTNGPGFLFNDVAAQNGQPSDEFRALILTLPTQGTFEPNEDSSFVYTGASDSFTYRGYKNGVAYGDYTVTMTIGTGQAVATVAYTVPGQVFSVAVAPAAPAALGAAVAYTVPTRTFSAQVSAIAPDALSATVAYTVPAQAFAAVVNASEPVAVSATVSYQVKAPAFSVTAQIAGSVVYIPDGALIVEKTGSNWMNV